MGNSRLNLSARLSCDPAVPSGNPRVVRPTGGRARECAEELATSQGLWPVGLWEWSWCSCVLGSVASDQSPAISGRSWAGRSQTPGSEASLRAPLLPSAAVTGHSGSVGHEASRATRRRRLLARGCRGPSGRGPGAARPLPPALPAAWGWGSPGPEKPPPPERRGFPVVFPMVAKPWEQQMLVSRGRMSELCQAEERPRARGRAEQAAGGPVRAGGHRARRRTCAGGLGWRDVRR